jgi:hypothetical protein
MTTNLDALAYEARRDLARAVNRFTPLKRRVTAATIEHVRPSRIRQALKMAERYAVNHPTRALAVGRQRAITLLEVVQAMVV